MITWITRIQFYSYYKLFEIGNPNREYVLLNDTECKVNS